MPTTPPPPGPPSNQMPPPPGAGSAVPPQLVVVEKKSNWLTTLFIVVGVLVVLLVGCVALLGLAVNEAVEEIENEEQAVLDAVTIDSCSVSSSLGFGETTVRYRSPFTELKSYVSVDIAFIDQDGVAVGSSPVVFRNVAGGAEGRDDLTWPLSDGVISVTCRAVEATVLD